MTEKQPEPVLAELLRNAIAAFAVITVITLGALIVMSVLQ